jgi:hypothetical protein
MKKKYIVIFFSIQLAVIFFLFIKNNSLFLGEKLPFPVDRVLWGQIKAYHPDILYEKYQIDFLLKNGISEEDTSILRSNNIKDFFYYKKKPKKLSEREIYILNKNKAQSFIKFLDIHKNSYLFIVSGDHSGSSNFRKIKVNLFKYHNEELKLVFSTTETYSTDPGFDSRYFSEKIIYFIYRYIFRDSRYQKKD